MFRKINNLLELFFSFRISKTNMSALKSKAEKSKGNIYVEFFGVPGVGKSYIFNKLDFIKNNWLTISEYKTINTKKNNMDQFNQNFYEKILSLKLQNIMTKEFSAYEKLDSLTRYKRIIDRDSLIYNNTGTIIVEEGLIHHFGTELLEMHKNDELQPYYNLFKNRIFIYCYSKPEVIAEQILKRKKETKKLLLQHKGLTYLELVEVQKAGLSSKKLMIDFLKSIRVPVLEIDTSKDNTKLIPNSDKITYYTHLF